MVGFQSPDSALNHEQEVWFSRAGNPLEHPTAASHAAGIRTAQRAQKATLPSPRWGKVEIVGQSGGCGAKWAEGVKMGDRAQRKLKARIQKDAGSSTKEAGSLFETAAEVLLKAGAHALTVASRAARRAIANSLFTATQHPHASTEHHEEAQYRQGHKPQ